jgi:hypothetical protein
MFHSTAATDLVIWHCNTQNDFSPGAAIFSLHALTSPSELRLKQLTGKNFLSCSFYLYSLFRKYVSYGFLIINFCNPGVHYETPCIFLNFIFLLCNCQLAVTVLASTWQCLVICMYVIVCVYLTVCYKHTAQLIFVFLLWTASYFKLTTTVLCPFCTQLRTFRASCIWNIF